MLKMKPRALYMALALAVLMIIPVVVAKDLDVTVVDKDGNAIEDAKVAIYNSTDDLVDSSCDGINTTDDSGKITCEGLEDREDYRIEVKHEDYRDISDDNALENWDKDDDKVIVVMRPRKYSLTVKVRDQSGDAVKDANVTIESLDEDLDEDDFGDNYDIYIFPDEWSYYKGFEVPDNKNHETTDDDGEAVLEDLEFNTKYNITVSKEGYLTVSAICDFHDKAKDDETEITLIEPGTGTITIIVRDTKTGEPIAGATVRLVGRDLEYDETKTTDENGVVEFTVITPNSYDAEISKARYGDGSLTNMELNGNGDGEESITRTISLVLQNNPPVADAGGDQYVMIGDVVVLNASGSTDPDGDPLGYTWSDSLGTEIPEGEIVNVTFDVAGEHLITLTVNDGRENATDQVLVLVDSPENCGDAVCSLSENSTGTCPIDCPVCPDAICGAGEAIANSSFYCPIDCGIPLRIRMENGSRLVANNVTSIVFVDPSTGAPVINASVQLILPNGTILRPEVFLNRVRINFTEPGEYIIRVSSPLYSQASRRIVVLGRGDSTWIIVLIAAAAVVIILLLLRYMNLSRGKPGYRAKRYRRRKPTLSSV